jgi:hypothetical protein
MSAAMKAMIIPFPQLHRLGAGVIAGGHHGIGFLLVNHLATSKHSGGESRNSV